MAGLLKPEILLYVVVLVVIWLVIYFRKASKHHHNRKALDAAHEAGLTEPASLHPQIIPTKCLGCGSCVKACPEGDVLGLIHNKAALINPTHCIGHGACKTACPFNAIELVFGTEKRGIDIPSVDADFQTNVPGIYIAGELGGMGLIRNAVEQGRQAMEAINRRKAKKNSDCLDVVIIGAGPAGFSASLSAIQHKLRYLTLEQDSLGGTVSHYPRGKLVMTAPVKLPLIGKMNFTETSKEALLAFWQNVERQSGVKINYNERMETINADGDGFIVKTTKGTYKTRSVLLSIGRRGTPRTLGVPGEEMTKVVYRLVDPEQYRGMHVLVVGGGDSALEAATSIADEANTTVTVSYRSDSFSRAKEKNREKILQYEDIGKVKLLMSSTVQTIFADSVLLSDHGGENHKIRNDAIIVSAGGILPTPFLKDIGIHVETKHGTA